MRLPIDDRTVAHLQVVIISKLRSRDSFAFSWTEPVSTGGRADHGVAASDLSDRLPVRREPPTHDQQGMGGRARAHR
ncbi:DUF7882 family protein [Clavibacter capsici]|uniref:DUF7882 family protein n=1 Tax=Clavibacter capsici TaxID=1874630 RepID=UPI003FA16EE2